MNVATVLNAKGRRVETVTLDQSLLDISRLMMDKSVGSVVVLDHDGKVRGVISERDIVRLIARHGAAAITMPVSACFKCLNRPLPVAREKDPLTKVLRAMTESRFRHLPVMENGELVGIVSIGDVVKQRIADTEFEAETLRNYIAS